MKRSMRVGIGEFNSVGVLCIVEVTKMSETENSQVNDSRVKIDSLVNVAGKVFLFIGGILVLRMVFDYYGEELFFVAGVMYDVSVFLIDTVIWFATYGYIGPAVTFIVVGLFLNRMGHKMRNSGD